MNIENNILIATGLKMQKTDIGWYDNNEVLRPLYEQYGGNTFDTLEFDKSWDWLMPVIEHIGNLRDWLNYPLTLKFDRLKKNIDERLLLVDMEMTYNHVVTFFKWYVKIEDD